MSRNFFFFKILPSDFFLCVGLEARITNIIIQMEKTKRSTNYSSLDPFNHAFYHGVTRIYDCLQHFIMVLHYNFRKQTNNVVIKINEMLKIQLYNISSCFGSGFLAISSIRPTMVRYQI